VKAAPAMKVAEGADLRPRRPAIQLAASRATPLTKLNKPKAVARRCWGASSFHRRIIRCPIGYQGLEPNAQPPISPSFGLCDPPSLHFLTHPRPQIV
jgi:hypothetical protein